MKYIHVEGIDNKGRMSHIDYEYPTTSPADVNAICRAMAWADREYDYEYNEDWELIPGTEYKRFDQITKVEIVNR